MEIFRNLKDKIFNRPEIRGKLEARRERYRKEELQYARDMMVYMYTESQASLSELSQSLGAMTGGAPEWIKHLKFESLTRRSRSTDELLELGINEIFQIVGASPKEQTAIRVQALTSARNYWVEHLGQPDLSIDEIILGRRRITQIEAKLEEFGGKKEGE